MLKLLLSILILQVVSNQNCNQPTPIPIPINKPPTIQIQQPDTVFIEPIEVALNGEGKNFIASEWRSLSKDTTITIDNPYALKTIAWINLPGVYKFELTLFSETKTIKDTVIITAKY